MIHRGDVVIYRDEADKPLKVISDPYEYGGQSVVTAKRMGGG